MMGFAMHRLLSLLAVALLSLTGCVSSASKPARRADPAAGVAARSVQVPIPTAPRVLCTVSLELQEARPNQKPVESGAEEHDTVMVTGAVIHPGRYHVGPEATLATVIMAAGGFSRIYMGPIYLADGRTHQVLIIRGLRNEAAYSLMPRFKIEPGDRIFCAEEIF